MCRPQQTRYLSREQNMFAVRTLQLPPYLDVVGDTQRKNGHPQACLTMPYVAPLYSINYVHGHSHDAPESVYLIP